jgi:hypothetical protein
MGVSTNDIFSAAGAQPAAPGSHGEAPSGFRLPIETRLGRVRLKVSDLARSLEFYKETLRFRQLRGDGPRAVLAAHEDDTPLIERRRAPGYCPLELPCAPSLRSSSRRTPVRLCDPLR